MKKLLSVMLAVMMLAALGMAAASAEDAVPGKPTKARIFYLDYGGWPVTAEGFYGTSTEVTITGDGYYTCSAHFLPMDSGWVPSGGYLQDGSGSDTGGMQFMLVVEDAGKQWNGSVGAWVYPVDTVMSDKYLGISEVRINGKPIPMNGTAAMDSPQWTESYYHSFKYTDAYVILDHSTPPTPSNTHPTWDGSPAARPVVDLSAVGVINTIEVDFFVTSTQGVKPPVLHDIEVVAGENGSASVSAAEAEEGDIITITATPNDGYLVDEIKAFAGDVSLTVTNNTFVMPDADVTVNVTFKPEPIVITVTHTTNPDANAFNADIALTDKQVTDMLVTDDDLLNKKDIAVYMEVKELADADVPAADKAAITEKAGEDTVAVYLDIQLLKKIGDGEPIAIKSTNGNMPITLNLPDTMIPANAESDTFYIIYYHDGEAKTLTAAFDTVTKILSFNANEFSTYALAYTPPKDLDVPPTGDEGMPFAWTMMLLCSAAMLAGVVLFQRKRAR